MHVSLTKQNVADMAKRQRSRIRLLMRELCGGVRALMWKGWKRIYRKEGP